MNSEALGDDFLDPDWSSPLDVERLIAAAPQSSLIKGMFLIPVAAEVKRRAPATPGIRDRYVPFQDYPMHEHMRVLALGATTIFPEVSLRQGLRKLGRGALAAFLESTVGRVTWAATDGGPEQLLRALARAYVVTMPGVDVQVLSSSATQSIIHFSGVYSYLDSHHVGIFEGALRSIGQNPRVRVKLAGPGEADFLLEYSLASSEIPPPRSSGSTSILSRPRSHPRHGAGVQSSASACESVPLRFVITTCATFDPSKVLVTVFSLPTRWCSICPDGQ